MDSCSNSSEFGSEDEDAEYALYAKLYFEPNEEVNKVGSSSNSGKDEIARENITSNNFCHGNRTQEQPLTSQLKTTENKICSKGEVISTKANYLPMYLSKTSSQPEATKNKICSEDGVHSRKASLGPAPLSHSEKSSKKGKVPIVIQPPQKRKRNVSICSIESISGKVPLDELYCNRMDFFDEEEEDEECLGGIDHHEGIRAVKKSRNEGRRNETPRPYLNGAGDSDDDSRCRRLDKITKKSKKLEKVEKTSDYSEISSSPKKNPRKRKKVDVVCLGDSDSDVICMSPASGKQKSVEGSCIDKGKTKAGGDQVKMDLRQKLSAAAKINCKSKLRKSKVVVSTYEPSSSSEDLPVLNKLPTVSSSESDSEDNLRVVKAGPKLAMNFNGSDSGLDCSPKRRSSGKRIPSCGQSTREMSSLYDSCDSDELSIEEIHSKQSGRFSTYTDVFIIRLICLHFSVVF